MVPSLDSIDVNHRPMDLDCGIIHVAEQLNIIPEILVVHCPLTREYELHPPVTFRNLRAKIAAQPRYALYEIAAHVMVQLILLRVRPLRNGWLVGDDRGEAKGFAANAAHGHHA